MKLSRRQLLTLSATTALFASGAAWLRQRGAASRRLASQLPAPLNPRRSQAGLLEVALTAQPSRWTIEQTAIEALSYNGLPIGERLEVQAGDTMRVTLHNQLDEPTNLHFHGLHIPPTGRGDNAFLHVEPGETYTYEFELAKNHPALMAYYHPHHHGLVAKQVLGGLGGAIVVRGELDQIPEIKAAREEWVILKDFAPDFARPPQGQEHLIGRQGNWLTVNGQQNPRWTLPQRGLLRLRLLNASPARVFDLAIEGHTFHLIGTDGGAIERPVELERLVLAPGERADVLVKGDQPSGTYRVLDYTPLASPPMVHGSKAESMSGMTGMSGMDHQTSTSDSATNAPQPAPPTPIATIQYGEAVDPLSVPQHLATIAALPEPTTTHRITLGHGMTANEMLFLLNGQMFDPQRVDVRTRLGQVEDWEIVNRGMTAHSFHLHTNPFQVISYNDQPATLRAWKDTINLKFGDVVKLRTRYDDFAGLTVYHCHVLDHEDMGMMGVLSIEA